MKKLKSKNRDAQKKRTSADVEGYTVRQGHPTLPQCYGIRVLSDVNNTMTRLRLQGSGMFSCFVTVRRSMTRPPVYTSTDGLYRCYLIVTRAGSLRVVACNCVWGGLSDCLPDLVEV